MILQLVANTLSVAASYMLIGASFGLIFRVYRFLNVSHAIPFMAAPYTVVAAERYFNLPEILSIPLGLIIGSVLVAGIHLTLFEALWRRKASPAIMIMSSLGVYVVFQNAISLFLGNDTVPLLENVRPRPIEMWGVIVVPAQLLLLSGAAIVLSALWLLIHRSTFGMAYRAVASNPELADVIGLNTSRVIFAAVIVGSLVAGAAGLLTCNDTYVEPTMGFVALLMGVVVVIIGGRDSLFGVVPAALLLSSMQTIGTCLGSAQWREAISFLVLLVFLLFRPQGFFGRNLMKSI